ncbi:MAG: Hsp20/alpha crystallin family protein [Nitriliruptorales bacterium]
MSVLSDVREVMVVLPVLRRDGEATTFQPWDEFERLRRQMWSLVDAWPTLPTITQPLFAELEETEDAFVVEIELPGVKKNDVSIELEGRRLIVHGERKERERSGSLRWRTRRVGEFHRAVVVPADVDEEGIAATLEQGMLSIRLPKSHAAKRRRIPVR